MCANIFALAIPSLPLLLTKRLSSVIIYLFPQVTVYANIFALAFFALAKASTILEPEYEVLRPGAAPRVSF